MMQSFLINNMHASNLAHTRPGFLVRKIILKIFFLIASAVFGKARGLLLYNDPDSS